MRILLVEDDLVLRSVMQRSLQDAGHRVDIAGSVEEADYLWRVQVFDAVLLDLNLPRSAQPRAGIGSGLTALRQARSRGDHTPVLVLTARDRTDERIAGLDAGADDYLGKPFELGEVEARLRALARRSQGTKDEVTVGQLQLDRRTRRFWLTAAPLDLPAREFEVLWELMTPPGRVCSKRELSSKLSDLDDVLAANALEAFVSRLRRKLIGAGVRIRTLRGLGYVLEATNERRSDLGANRPGDTLTDRHHSLPSLRNKLLARVLAPLAATWIAGTVVAVGVAQLFAQRAFDRSLLDDAYLLATHVRSEGARPELNLTRRELNTVLFDQAETVYFSIRDGQGRLVAGHGALHMAAPSPPDNYRFGDISFEGLVLRSVTLHQESPTSFDVIVAQTTRVRDALLRQLLLVSMLPQLGLMLLVGWWIGRGIRAETGPLLALEDAVEQRSSHDLAPLSVVATTHEVAALTEAVNGLLARLQRSLQLQREFSGNVAHELRTPLAGIRALSEYGLAHSEPQVWREQLEAIRSREARASDLIDKLLALSLAGEAESAMVLRPIRLDEVVREAVLRVLQKAEAADVDLGAQGIDNATSILGDHSLVDGILTNLLDNALRYGRPAHGVATITVSVFRRPQAIVLAVEDNGAGAPEESQRQLAARGQRGEAAQLLASGAGFGLALVAQYAELMGATMRLASGPMGRGWVCEIHFRLPESAQAQAD